MNNLTKHFREICKNCGCTFGAHHAGTSPKYPRNYCPGHENRMDWENGPGTTFEPTGVYKKSRIEINFDLAEKMIAFYHPFKKEKTMKSQDKELRVDNAEQDIQKIKDLLQQTEDATEEFFKSPYRNERAINFLNGKALAYRKVLKILRN